MVVTDVDMISSLTMHYHLRRRLCCSLVPALLPVGRDPISTMGIVRSYSLTTPCGCAAKKQTRKKKNKVKFDLLNQQKETHTTGTSNSNVHPEAPMAEKGPKVSLTAEEGIQALQNLDKSVFDWANELDRSAQRRIANNLAVIKSGQGYTLYEKRNAALSAANTTKDPAAVRAAQLLSTANIQSGNLEPYETAVAQLPPATRTAFLQALTKILLPLQSNTGLSPTVTSLDRAKSTILEEVSPERKKDYFQQHSNLIFMTDHGLIVRGKGASMLPTLPLVNTTFSALIDDSSTEGNHYQSSYREFSRAEAIDLVTKVHNEQVAISEFLKGMKPIHTHDIRKNDIVHFVVTVPSGDTCFMAKRVTAMEGDLVEYRGGMWTVPNGTFWALGDNPERSTDSRDYGAVPLENLRSKLLLSYDVNEGYFEWFGD